jgi:hypothetical protein
MDEYRDIRAEFRANRTIGDRNLIELLIATLKVSVSISHVKIELLANLRC